MNERKVCGEGNTEDIGIAVGINRDTGASVVVCFVESGIAIDDASTAETGSPNQPRINY